MDQLFQGEFRVVDREFQALEHGLFVYLSGQFAPCKDNLNQSSPTDIARLFDLYLHRLVTTLPLAKFPLRERALRPLQVDRFTVDQWCRRAQRVDQITAVTWTRINWFRSCANKVCNATSWETVNGPLVYQGSQG